MDMLIVVGRLNTLFPTYHLEPTPGGVMKLVTTPIHLLTPSGELQDVMTFSHPSADRVLVSALEYFATGSVYVIGNAPKRRATRQWNGHVFVEGLAVQVATNRWEYRSK